MQTFTDKTGKRWSIELDFDAILRVQAEAGVDLLDPTGGKTDKYPSLMHALTYDLRQLYFVLRSLLKPQWGQAEEADFARAIGGQTIAAAKTAFLEEWLDFFRQAAETDKAAALESQIDLIATARKVAVEQVAIQARAVKETLTAGPGNTPGSSPALSESETSAA